MSAPEQDDATTRVMWVAPNFNAYKVRTLNLLAASEDIELTVFAGAGQKGAGHRYGVVEPEMSVEFCDAEKSQFGRKISVLFQLLGAIRKHRSRVVLMPIEKKLLGLIVGLMIARPFYRFTLVSYNHPCLRSSGRIATGFDLALTRWLFSAYNRIVFYSEGGMKLAVNEGWIKVPKAAYANNTLTSREIEELRSDPLLASPPFKLLFVGRLIPEKKFDRMFELFVALRDRGLKVELHLVGDGPEQAVVERAVEKYEYVYWHGALVDESDLAPHFNSAHAVLHPGSSGLIVAHAFAYGKPFITLKGAQFWHGPEIDYLSDGVNGLLLEGSDTSEDARRIAKLLNHTDQYQAFCNAARETWTTISIDRWLEKMTSALKRADKPRPRK